MVVGPFALIAGLLPSSAGTAAEIVRRHLGRDVRPALDLDDLYMAHRPWNGTRRRCRGKQRPGRADPRVGQARPAGRRVQRDASGLGGTPGLEASLPGFSRLMGPLLRTAGDGADTAIWLAADPAPAGDTGRLFLDRRARPFDRAPQTRLTGADRRRLWDLVVRLVTLPILHQTRRSAPGNTRPQPALEPSDDPHPRTHRDRPADRRTFDYIADFDHADEWDPNTTDAQRLGTEEPGLGARFALEVRMGDGPRRWSIGSPSTTALAG